MVGIGGIVLKKNYIWIPVDFDICAEFLKCIFVLIFRDPPTTSAGRTFP